jgi:hypothetical protein
MRCAHRFRALYEIAEVINWKMAPKALASDTLALSHT